MKKFKTIKEIKRENNNIIAIGYCNAQFLLANHEPVAYHKGIYGWNFDVYEVYGITICTGYRGMPSTLKSNGIDDFEKKARDIILDRTSYDGYKYDKVEELLKEFCELNLK